MTSLNFFKQGYETFLKQKDPDLFKSLDKGQHPKAMIISCVDARVEPSIIFNTKPGDLFIFRSVAGMVPTFKGTGQCGAAGAALEFGLDFLEIPKLFIIGHSKCGGIDALVNGTAPKINHCLDPWVDPFKPILNNRHESLDCCAKDSLKKSYEHCMTYPWIKKRVENGQLEVELFFFDIESTTLQHYDATQDAFGKF